MSVVNPTIDDLLSVTDENRFLLCEIAARRARDVNDMMRNQHNRAEQLADVEDISQFMSDDDGRAPNPLSIAFDEIAPRKDEDGTTKPGILSFDARTLHADLGLDETAMSDDQIHAVEEKVEAEEDAQEEATGSDDDADASDATKASADAPSAAADQADEAPAQA